ncbi:hypothetical protein DLM46_20780 [Paraburkholderia lacunae]|uniref:Uncharacterized protein n=1 Tax=Paraburkholderia lacunae TaxID=2211104 RepID=A0A370N5N7_9BURK|nr:hypothetical protein DLM46_20780 [Paraburkholderia lacunae]
MHLTHAVSQHSRPHGDVARARHATFRVGLRLWGFDEHEVSGWITGLPTLGGRLSWEITHDRDGDGAGLVIHLVRSSDVLAPFCWNCVGANRTIRRAQGGVAQHVALFSGDARRLPTPRYGLWAIARTRSEIDTLHEIARTLVFPRVMRTR